jgi:Ca2+/Na+ antiporter
MRSDQTPRDPRTEWQSQPTEDFHMSRALLDRYVSTSHRRLRRLTAAQYAGATLGLIVSTFVAVTFDGRMMRIGAMMLALLFAFALVLIYRAPHGRDAAPAIADPSIESYRADLERHRMLFSGYRLWSRLVIGVPVAIVFCVGFARAYPAIARIIYLELAAIVAGISISCVVAHRKARQYQQEVEELDALRR